MSNRLLKGLLQTREDIKISVMPVLRGTGLGAILGILPGTGPTIASFLSYGLERRLARNPERFGNGAIESVTAPDTAANAAAFTWS